MGTVAASFTTVVKKDKSRRARFSNINICIPAQNEFRAYLVKPGIAMFTEKKLPDVFVVKDGKLQPSLI